MMPRQPAPPGPGSALGLVLGLGLLVFAAVGVAAAPVWQCPLCLGSGKVAPYFGFVFEQDMLECVTCEGSRKVTALRRWSWWNDPLREIDRQWPTRRE